MAYTVMAHIVMAYRCLATWGTSMALPYLSSAVGLWLLQRDDAEQAQGAGWCLPSLSFLFTTFRGMPTASSEGQVESEGGIGTVSSRRVLFF